MSKSSPCPRSSFLCLSSAALAAAAAAERMIRPFVVVGVVVVAEVEVEVDKGDDVDRRVLFLSEC